MLGSVSVAMILTYTTSTTLYSSLSLELQPKAISQYQESHISEL